MSTSDANKPATTPTPLARGAAAPSRGQEGAAAGPSSGAAALALDSPLTAVRGIGPARAAALLQMGIKNVAQLVAHLPTRHEIELAETPVAELIEAVGSGGGCARGTISATRIHQGRKPRFEAVLMDDTGRLELLWFGAMYMRDRISPGVRVRVQGKVTRRGSAFQMINPRTEILPDEGEEPPERSERLRPVYPATEAFSSRQIESAVGAILEPTLALVHDHLSEEFRKPRELPELRVAYRGMHRPGSQAEADAARRRLAYDELLLLQLGLALKRAHRDATSRAPAVPISPALDGHVRAILPFKLTPSQDAVVREVADDLARERPANRLIQGDVGSGKTAVALHAMLLAVAAGHQAALMAPTELLAEQHAAAIAGLLQAKGSRVRVALLTGSLTGEPRRELLASLAAGRVDLLIGTHALLTESVQFRSLAVVVIDEQHRFGVHQRAAIRAKSSSTPTIDPRQPVPHTLVMTATPIPRTLAMTLLGDLDVSTIRQLPPGRKPVATRVVPAARRDDVYRFVRARLDKGEQAFIVAPTIGDGLDAALDSDGLLAELDAPGGGAAGASTPPVLPRGVLELHAQLAAGPLAGVRLGLLHGRLSPAQRNDVVARFRARAIDALVCTTIIEVGVDVPNATVIVIEDATRFGLAQLHQLRGRVGRGTKPSACILVAPPAPNAAAAKPPPEPGADATDPGSARLAAMARIRDGFKLAEVDLQLRGFGDVIGVRQSGMPPFKLADPGKDLDLLVMAKRDAAELVAADPDLASPGSALLLRRLLKAHGRWLGLGDTA